MAKLSNTYVKAKMTMFFGFATEITEIMNFFGNRQWNSSLHHFYALIFFCIKALRQWRQIQEALKRWNFNYDKKLKQWSDEAFNAGKEIEVMKHLPLHRIASLHRFIASSLLLPSFGDILLTVKGSLLLPSCTVKGGPNNLTTEQWCSSFVG
jgi:hypothetical protein